MEATDSTAKEEAASWPSLAKLFPADQTNVATALLVGQGRWKRQVADEVALEIGAVSSTEKMSLLADFEGAGRIAAEIALALVSPSVAPVALSDSAATLLSMLVGNERDNARRLARVDVGVQRLLGGPMKSGRLHLLRAYRNRFDLSIVEESLRLADVEFAKAHGYSSTRLQESTVEIHLGIVAMLRGQKQEAEHWLSAASSSCRKAIDEADAAHATAAADLGLDQSKTMSALAFAGKLSIPHFALGLSRDWGAAASFVKTGERKRIVESIALPAIEFCEKVAGVGPASTTLRGLDE